MNIYKMILDESGKVIPGRFLEYKDLWFFICQEILVAVPKAELEMRGALAFSYPQGNSDITKWWEENKSLFDLETTFYPIADSGKRTRFPSLEIIRTELPEAKIREPFKKKWVIPFQAGKIRGFILDKKLSWEK